MNEVPLIRFSLGMARLCPSLGEIHGNQHHHVAKRTL
jgi:hypothetical protein